MLALWRDLADLERALWNVDRSFGPRSWYRGTPRVTLSEGEHELVVRAEVPGVAGKDLEISLEKDVLTIRGERRQETPEGHRVHRRERGSLRFSHSFTLPARVDAGKASARLANGVLTLTLPRASEDMPRQIPVATA
jgi:HSP20 family protein